MKTPWTPGPWILANGYLFVPTNTKHGRTVLAEVQQFYGRIAGMR